MEIGHRERRSNLTILGTQPSDAGAYGCVAMNEAGIDMDQATLTVHGEIVVLFQWVCVSIRDCDHFICAVVPRILFPPVNFTYVVNETDPTILVCSATGIPPPEVTWMRNGVLLDENVDPHISLSNPSDPEAFPTTGGNIYSVYHSLTINNTRDNDSDTYTCVASNGNARTPSVTQDFELVVQGMPQP